MAKRFFGVCFAVALLAVLCGCGDNKKEVPNTEEARQSFRADPNKMPAEAKARVANLQGNRAAAAKAQEGKDKAMKKP